MDDFDDVPDTGRTTALGAITQSLTVISAKLDQTIATDIQQNAELHQFGEAIKSNTVDLVALKAAAQQREGSSKTRAWIGSAFGGSALALLSAGALLLWNSNAADATRDADISHIRIAVTEHASSPHASDPVEPGDVSAVGARVDVIAERQGGMKRDIERNAEDIQRNRGRRR